MNWKGTTATLLAVVATAGTAFYAGRASATGVPAANALTYSGTLFDTAGAAVKVPVQVRVRLFDGAVDNGDPAKCASSVVMTEAGTGRFDVPLGDACAAAVHAQPDLWVEIVVGVNPLTMLPRVKAGAVPYSLESAVAGLAAGATGKLQQSLDYATAGADQVAALKKQVNELAATAAKQSDLDAAKAELAAVKSKLPAQAGVVPKSIAFPKYNTPLPFTVINDSIILWTYGIGKATIMIDGGTNWSESDGFYPHLVMLSPGVHTFALNTTSGTADPCAACHMVYFDAPAP